MKTTRCAAPDCKSYHMGHETAGDHELELKRWGWTWRGDGPYRVHLCPAHSKEFVPVPEKRPTAVDYCSD